MTCGEAAGFGFKRSGSEERDSGWLSFNYCAASERRGSLYSHTALPLELSSVILYSQLDRDGWLVSVCGCEGLVRSEPVSLA